MTLTGDLTVQGTTTTLDTSVVQIEDPVLQVNYIAGTAQAGANAGIQVGRSGGTDALLQWNETTDLWEVGIVGTLVPLVGTTSTQTLTNKTLTAPAINGAVGGTADSQTITALTTAGITATANIDIGSFDLRASTLTADGLTATRVVFAGTDGVLSSDSDMTFATDTLTVTKLGAYEQAGAVDFSDEAMTNVNIDSGAIDGAVIGANNPEAGSFDAVVGTTGVYSGILKTDDTTDATTNADGSLQTDGGLSVAKAIFNSTAATLAAASGVVTMGSTTGATVSAAGILNVNNATEATSATDGSLQTDGGLSVVKSAVIGDDLDLLSDGAIINIGSTSKFTLTDQSANNCVMAASGARLAFGNAGEYISGDGTDLDIISSGDLDITATLVDMTAALTVSGAVTIGADGAGADFKAFGATASESMLYDASENYLKFSDSGGTLLTIGGDADSEYAIDVTAGADNINKIRATAFVTYSDERLKSDVSPMRNALKTVNSLKAVDFTWNEGGTRDFGFLAQDLKKVIPGAVHGDKEGLYGVDYGRLTAVLVSAIQEQSVQIKALQAKINKK